MKKSVILLILIVYIASIMVVGFYGIKIKVYDEKIMVEDIICENLEEFNGIDCAASEIEGYKKLYSQGIDYYATKKYYDEYEDEGFVIIVKFAVLPRDATEQGIEFVFETNDQTTSSSENNSSVEQTKPRYTIIDNKNGTATITIYKKCSVVFQVRPMDKASNAIKTVRIDVAKYFKD